MLEYNTCVIPDNYLSLSEYNSSEDVSMDLDISSSPVLLRLIDPFLGRRELLDSLMKEIVEEREALLLHAVKFLEGSVVNVDDFSKTPPLPFKHTDSDRGLGQSPTGQDQVGIKGVLEKGPISNVSLTQDLCSAVNNDLPSSIVSCEQRWSNRISRWKKGMLPCVISIDHLLATRIRTLLTCELESNVWEWTTAAQCSTLGNHPAEQLQHTAKLTTLAIGRILSACFKRSVKSISKRLKEMVIVMSQKTGFTLSDDFLNHCFNAAKYLKEVDNDTQPGLEQIGREVMIFRFQQGVTRNKLAECIGVSPLRVQLVEQSACQPEETRQILEEIDRVYHTLLSAKYKSVTVAEKKERINTFMSSVA